MHTFVHLMINQRRRTMLMAALILVSGGALFYHQINVTQSFPPNGKHSARKEPLGPSHTPLRLNIKGTMQDHLNLHVIWTMRILLNVQKPITAISKKP